MDLADVAQDGHDAPSGARGARSPSCDRTTAGDARDPGCSSGRWRTWSTTRSSTAGWDDIEVMVEGTSVEVRDHGLGIDPEDQPPRLRPLLPRDDGAHRARVGPRVWPSSARSSSVTAGQVWALQPTDGGAAIGVRLRSLLPRVAGARARHVAPEADAPGRGRDRCLHLQGTAALNHPDGPDRAGGHAAHRTGTLALLWAVLAGAAVAVALGVYGREHDAAGQALFTLGFSGTINMKAWLATIAFVAGDRPGRAGRCGCTGSSAADRRPTGSAPRTD